MDAKTTSGEIIQMYGKYLSDTNSVTIKISSVNLLDSEKSYVQNSEQVSGFDTLTEQYERVQQDAKKQYLDTAQSIKEYVRYTRDKSILESTQKQLDELMKKYLQREKVARDEYDVAIKKRTQSAVNTVYKYVNGNISCSFVLPNGDNFKTENGVYDVHVLYFPSEKLAFTLTRLIKNGDSGRKHAIMYCYNNKSTEVNKITKHTYYTSISDGSFWRYCIRVASVYDKGYNYVSTTMINMNLQKFIDFIISDYKLFDTLVDGRNAVPGTCATINDNGVVFAKRLNDKFCGEGKTLTGERIVCVRNNVFRVFDDVFNYSSGADASQGIDGYNMYQKFSIIENVLTNHASDSNLNKYYDDLRECIKKELGNFIPVDDLMPYGDVLESACKNRAGYKKVYNAMSNFFNKNFKYRKDLGIILHEKDRKAIIEDYTLNMDMYSVFYEDSEGCVYQVYYVKFNAFFSDFKLNNTNRDPKSDSDSKDYKAIIHIIPYGINTGNSIIRVNHISPYGLDNTYVSAGIFVSKLFDYKRQTKSLHISDPINVYAMKNPDSEDTTRLKKYMRANNYDRNYTPLFDIIDMQWLPN